MNRRAFLQATAASATLLTANPAWSAARPVPEDGDLLADARERIQKHRQGDGVVCVRGRDGRPVSGATVNVQQERHEFLFGCNFFMFGRLGDPALEENYRRRFAALFNYATLGFYWPYYEPERGHPNYEYTDKALAWCAPRGIRCKGHPLVWDFADPKWLPHDFAEIRALANARVRDIVSRFKGRLDFWDVVNEPTALGRFHTRLGEGALSLGPVPYVTDRLKIARSANPQATLLVNDYLLNPAYFKILEAVREEGRGLFDAVGLQSHMHDGLWPLGRVWEVCDTFAKLGVPLHFTETTVVSGPRLGAGENWGPTTPELEEKQADAAVKFYTMVFAHPATAALTWWDFSDRGAWQRAAAGLVRRDMSPKPAYDRLHALIRGDWWTKAQGRTDARGEFATRAFFGTHRVTVDLPEGKKLEQAVDWRRGAPNRFELTAA